MDIVKTLRVPPGKYVVAVSGGVDSMVLLDLLRQLPHAQLTVAHYDHGIREDSREDRLLVQDFARVHCSFVYDEGNLGVGVSENDARKARYEFSHRSERDRRRCHNYCPTTRMTRWKRPCITCLGEPGGRA